MVLLLSAALAGSYDSLEIGGLWGSHTANGGEAPWWNPAGDKSCDEDVNP